MHFIVSLRTNFMYHFVHCLTASAIIIMTQYLCFIPRLLKGTDCIANNSQDCFAHQ